MSPLAKRLCGTIVAVCACSAAAQTEVRTELWDRPRTGAAIVAEESIKRAAGELLAKPKSRLVIHHPTGQEPLSQAEELKAWLTALAIDSRRIVLRSGLPAAAPMKLEVIE
jgi:hypothetical protein